jgi:hypothetical protein
MFTMDELGMLRPHAMEHDTAAATAEVCWGGLCPAVNTSATVSMLLAGAPPRVAQRSPLCR